MMKYVTVFAANQAVPGPINPTNTVRTCTFDILFTNVSLYISAAKLYSSAFSLHAGIGGGAGGCKGQDHGDQTRRILSGSNQVSTRGFQT